MVALLALSLFLIALPATATVSGDNGKIVFVTERDGNPEIYLMEPDGTGLVNLTNHPAQDREPAWSPDGRQIAFVSDRSGEFAIYVMQADGSEVRRLAPGEEPDWSPDGDTIVFTRGSRGIFASTLDGGETRLTDPTSLTPPMGISGISDASPAWSPDGSRIVFVRKYQSPSARVTTALLTVMGADGSQATALPAQGEHLFDPDWSPDGGLIVVSELSGIGNVPGVLMVAADGSSATTVPGLAGDERNVGWSPDGRKLVAATGISTSSPDISVMNPDGSDEVNLTNHPNFDYDPAWQPLNPYPIGLVDPGTGVWHLRFRDGRVTSFYYGSPGDLPFLGDWDGDGVETPGLYRQSDGFIYLRNSNTQGVADIRFFFGNPGDIPLAGDFDGDGFDTISIYRPSEARIYVIDQLGSDDGGLGAAAYSYLFGNPGDKPFIGDFNGDGIDTVGLHRESTGMVYYRNSNTQGIAENTFVYGDPGDRLVAHDWNDDGRDSPAVFRPGNHTVYFLFVNANGVADAQFIWGAPRWLPVAGDFGQP
jgi:Tol biopolymer transport system component